MKANSKVISYLNDFCVVFTPVMLFCVLCSYFGGKGDTLEYDTD